MTLGSLTAVRGLARLFGNDTTVFNADLSFAGIAGNFAVPVIGAVSWLSVIAIVVVAVSWFILRRTVLGVHIYAVGGNPAAARLSGIKVWSVLLFVYGTSGLLSGLAGLMQAAQLQSANGLQLGTGYELDAIAAVILGGTSFVGGVGSVIGTLIGALIIAVLANGLILAGVSDVWQYIIKGLVIIGAVALDRPAQPGRSPDLTLTPATAPSKIPELAVRRQRRDATPASRRTPRQTVVGQRSGTRHGRPLITNRETSMLKKILLASAALALGVRRRSGQGPQDDRHFARFARQSVLHRARQGARSSRPRRPTRT